MSRYRAPALAWAAIAALLAGVQYVAVRTAPGGPRDLWPLPGGRLFFAGWTQFDAWEFISIADDGYWYRDGARSPTSFFPLYPLLIRAVRPLFGDTVVAAVAVSAAAGLAATLLLWRWLQEWDLDPRVRALSIAVFLAYPWGWFLFGVPFSDSLFVALVIGAFLLVERDRLVWAGVVGALATATRPTGMALVPALVLLGMERKGALAPGPEGPGWWSRLRLPTVLHRDRLVPAVAAPALALAGVGAYMAYLGIRWGKPLVFITDQSLYNGTGLKTILKSGLVVSWIEWNDPVHTLVITAQTLIALGVLCSVAVVGRRFGWGYGLFLAILFVLPALATRDFNSTGRYLLAAFPVAVVVAEKLVDRPVARYAWLAGCGLVVVALNVGFARSRMVS